MILRELQYRRTGTDEWLEGPRLPLSEGEELVVEGLEMGVEYDLRVRTVDDTSGIATRWKPIDAVLPEVPDEQPEPPANLRLDGGCLALDPSPSAGVVGYLIRSHPGREEHWESAEPHNDDEPVQPPFPVCTIPGGRRVFLARAVDEYGNESDTIVLHTHRAPAAPDEAVVVQSRDEAALLWPGTIHGGAGGADLTGTAFVGDPPLHPALREPLHLVGDEPLQQPEESPAHGRFVGDDLPLLPQDLGTALHTPQFPDLVYITSFEPCAGTPAVPARLTLEVTTTARIWRAYWRRRDAPLLPPNLGDTLHPLDGSDPLHPPQPPWRPWPGMLSITEPGLWEFMVWVPGGHVQPSVQNVVLRLSLPVRQQVVKALAVPVGGTRVQPETPWHAVLRADATLRKAATGSDPRESRIVDLDSALGPLVAIEDGSGGSVAGSLDVTVWGY